MSPNPLLPLIYKMSGHFTLFSMLAGGVIATDINFRDQVTLGSIIVSVIVVLSAGMITIRSKIANIWREEAEGERAAKERLQEELNQCKLSFSEFENSQQLLRHDLKDKIAELKTQLKVMEAKTDLSSAMEAIKGIAISQKEGHHQTHIILEEIRDKLPHADEADHVGGLLTEIRDKLPTEPLIVKEVKDDDVDATNN
jgi:hypothetical protein